MSRFPVPSSPGSSTNVVGDKLPPKRSSQKSILQKEEEDARMTDVIRGLIAQNPNPGGILIAVAI